MSSFFHQRLRAWRVVSGVNCNPLEYLAQPFNRINNKKKEPQLKEISGNKTFHMLCRSHHSWVPAVRSMRLCSQSKAIPLSTRFFNDINADNCFKLCSQALEKGHGRNKEKRYHVVKKNKP